MPEIYSTGFTRVTDYVKANGPSIAATVAVGAGWTAAVMSGPKVVVGTCLVGGGMFATLVAHEALKTGVAVGTQAVRNVVSLLRLKRTLQQQPPAMHRTDQPAAGAGA